MIRAVLMAGASLVATLGLAGPSAAWDYVTGIDPIDGVYDWYQAQEAARDSDAVLVVFGNGVTEIGGPLVVAVMADQWTHICTFDGTVEGAWRLDRGPVYRQRFTVFPRLDGVQFDVGARAMVKGLPQAERLHVKLYDDCGKVMRFEFDVRDTPFRWWGDDISG